MSAINYKLEEMEALSEDFKERFIAKFGIVPRVVYTLESSILIPRVSLDNLEEVGNEILWETYSKWEFPLGIKTKKRNRELVLIRQCIFKIAVDMGYILEKIAAKIGFDHATVIHGRKTINNLIYTKNRQVHNTMVRIEDLLKKKYAYDGNVQFNSPKRDNAQPVLFTL